MEKKAKQEESIRQSPFKRKWRQFRTWQKAYWKKYQVTKLIILTILTTLLVFTSYLFYLAKTTNIKVLESSLKTTTTIFDEKNEAAGALYGQKGTYVELSEISPLVQKALIATEDRSFWTNHGIDPKGMGRAVFRKITSFGSNAGGGGSTITQQLAKNAYLSVEQTMNRKAREFFLALEINKQYSKKEILTMYLNQSYFGNGVWGIQDASLKYFGVEAKNLTLEQAATLVGMLKGPEIYNPLNSNEYANNRKNTVLQNMVDVGDLSQAEADKAASIDIATEVHDGYHLKKESYKYPSFYDAVIEELENKYGLKEKDILNNGYEIYTTLNQDYQGAMQSTFAEDSFFPQSEIDGEYAQGASIAIDPATGGVQALVGQRGKVEEHVFRGFNRATQMKRSPASTIKPIVVYTPALEDGWKFDSMLEDKPQDYYKVAQNYSREYSGEVPMYEALADSLNLPAVYLLHKIGIDRGYEEGIKFGLPLEQKDKYWGLALGGLRKGVTPMQMTQAYSVFGNAGTQIETHLVRKVLDSSGKVIVDVEPERKQITSSGVASRMTSMMLGTFSNGTGVNANPAGYIMAGKTGTTETSFDASKTNDQWVIGYTPDVVITTWLGFDNPSQEKGHYLDGSSTEQASVIFQNEASQIMPLVSGKKFSDLYPNIENAYAMAGRDTGDNEETGSFTPEADDLRKKAEDALDDAVDKAKDIWKSITDWFK
ncbi:penicillin-binding protein 2A [Pilibacter termitis]|uniref:Penicillin-binding protein 2A n=1 Tax=Pilibacter termitis TaxID=263852 RepID=A0A1T4L9X2_9ENTE|nr:PBP1A family penicillin-binding protein [Pilibacter termitis]SJZ51555.1 penicillin-binding protein 2A [Pilibacter termitis]